MDKGKSEAADSKPCSTCGIVKPLDDFSLDNRRRDGRQARCRKCVKAYQERYKQEHRERYLELRRAEYVRNKPRQQAYQQANSERLRVQAQKRRQSMSDEEREADRTRHRRLSAEYRSRNPDLCNERVRKWSRANPDKLVDGVNRRRALKRGNGTPEKFTRTEIGERDGWICGICDQSIDKTLRFPDQQSPSLDHIIPLSLGGEHSRANSRISHWICNVRRGADRRRDAAA